ncbi:hypothetical protein GCM10010919_00950 [Alishewanella longhuensis]|uniref:Uncharacterized protein n=1 Tax=Alishewanella longhuensis TaxID=1091037 RepID=A0ABQ3KUX4_9ALTE|nr:hypothetical protein [Alishewanella longhuensis]GHG58898.1 hypothetical protein GCM10010919_00950 [Alishewanella longhuensis]
MNLYTFTTQSGETLSIQLFDFAPFAAIAKDQPHFLELVRAEMARINEEKLQNAGLLNQTTVAVTMENTPEELTVQHDPDLLLKLLEGSFKQRLAIDQDALNKIEQQILELTSKPELTEADKKRLELLEKAKARILKKNALRGSDEPEMEDLE